MSKFMDKIKETARADKKTIVLAEGEERRTIDAAAQILKEGYANIILLGNESKIKSMADGLDISEATIIDPDTSELTEELETDFMSLERKKGMLPAQAAEKVKTYCFLAVCWLKQAEQTVWLPALFTLQPT